MSYARKAGIDEKDQAYSGAAICIQVVESRDCSNVGIGRGSVSQILERATVANLT